MRIGIDARELLDRPTGVGRYLAELLARWTRHATFAPNELILFFPRPPTGGRPWIGTGGAPTREVIVPGTPGTRWEQGALASAVRREAPDAFFAPGYTAPLRVRCPVVVAIHDVSFAAHPEWFQWREGLRRRLLTRWSASAAQRVITISAFSRDEIIEHLGVPQAKIVVTPLAVDAHPALHEAGSPTREAPAATPGCSRMVLYAGSILERRHVPELVASFARIAAQVPDAILEVVGDNRTWPRVDPGNLARALGVGDRVHVRDYVEEQTLEDLYRRARVFVFLSEYEGFGLPPLEAMRAGVPAVVLDTPVAREVYGEAAVLVDLGDPSALDDALERLLNDESARRRHLEASQRTLARYTWDATARQTFDVLLGAAR